MYCCTDFELRAQTEIIFLRRNDGTWAILDEIAKIKFCPFCAADLEPRFTVHDCTLNWKVCDGTKTVAVFDTRKKAEDYIDTH